MRAKRAPPIDLRPCVDYGQWNPRKHGYVANIRDWRRCSFHRFVNLNEYTSDWGAEGAGTGYDDLDGMIEIGGAAPLDPTPSADRSSPPSRRRETVKRLVALTTLFVLVMCAAAEGKAYIQRDRIGNSYNS